MKHSVPSSLVLGLVGYLVLLPQHGALVTAASLRRAETRSLASAYGFVELGQDSRCSIDENGNPGVEGVDYVARTFVSEDSNNVLKDCKAQCSQLTDCKGIEVEIGYISRCELWWTLPVEPTVPIVQQTQNQQYYEIACYRKEDPSDQCTEVHRRPFFGFAGDEVFSIHGGRTGDWQDFAQLHEAFGSANEDPSPGLVRKWRIYAIYSMSGYQQTEKNIQIMFDLQDNTVYQGEAPMFTLPRIRTSGNKKADGYSTWFQFGSGIAGDANKSDGVAQVRVKNSDSGNQNNNNNNNNYYYDSKDLFWAELVAYDCEQ